MEKMNKIFLRFYSPTLVALRNRREQQKKPQSAWKFVFGEITMALLDAIADVKHAKLHIGLESIFEMENISRENARIKAKNLNETLLNLITFVTSSPCKSAKLLDIIESGRKGNPLHRGNVFDPAPESQLWGSVKVIKQQEFGETFEAYKKSKYQQRIMRVLSWFRKGLDEENIIDEFISYWIAIEVLRGILRHKLCFKMRNPKEWDGVKRIFEEKLNFYQFSDIKNARDSLLHGFRELSTDFVQEIENNYLVPSRKAVIFAIGDILGLEENLLITLAGQNPRRVRSVPWQVIEGHLEGFTASSLDEIINKSFPTVSMESKQVTYRIDKNGKLSVNIKARHIFKGPPGAKQHIEAIEQWGDKEAGIDSVNIENIKRT